jgi:hypothetical protein
LPSNLKIQAKEALMPFIYLPKVQGIIDYMMAEDWSDKLPVFYKYTNQLDKSRGENLFNLIPEFNP